MAARRISIDLEQSLYRRFRARVEHLSSSLGDVLTEIVGDWLGAWGEDYAVHLVASGESLQSISECYYNNPDLYLTIAHFNNIPYPMLLQAGTELMIPEPHSQPQGLAPAIPLPMGVPKVTVSADIDASTHRRFKARAAFEGTTMTEWLYALVSRWVGSWPERTFAYTVRAGDSLSALALRFYEDAARYWTIAHFNGIANPSLLRAGQRLLIPDPVTLGPLPAGESPFIFGIHDRGGEHLMAEMGKKGWILATEEIGRNPHDLSGGYYRDLETSGYGVLVRLNHSYHRGSDFPGTLPEVGDNDEEYREFAVRCGNFVEHSYGCHIWIIANEMNHPYEWPGGPEGQAILPSSYADCFRQCRSEIHARAGHADDQVVVGAVAPWNDSLKYPDNERGDWIRYLADLLVLLEGDCDGIALHTYTHGADPRLISAQNCMDAPFEDRYYHFRTYRQFLECIPASMRGLPVYITETNQGDPWAQANTRWAQTAYAEIDRWNQDPTHQSIRSLILYRWSRDDDWSFCDLMPVQDDFRAAMSHDYRWWR